MKISATDAFGIMIDVQEFFLRALPEEERRRIVSGSAMFAELISYFRMPLLMTVERPLDLKGGSFLTCPRDDSSRVMEKDFFDLTREPEIASHLSGLKRRQAVVTGSETDVCVLQSCLGLHAMGFDVFVVEDLLFSSSNEVGSAKERMRRVGITFLTLKTLYYELKQAVSGSRHVFELERVLGSLPESLRSL